MFRLSYIHVKNWCQHVDKRIEFAAGTTCLLGPNGCGKSNLLYAGFTCLTGDLLTSDTLSDNINWLADSSVIETGFSINGIEGVVTREYIAPLMRNDEGEVIGRDKVRSKASLKFGKEKKLTSTSKVTAKLLEVLGLSSAILRSHVIVPQGKLQELLFKPKQDRIKAFQTLVPALVVAERKRADILAEMNRHPPISTGQTRDEVQKTLDEMTARRDQLATDVATMKQQLLEYGDLDGKRDQIAQADIAATAEMSLQATLPLLDGAKVKVMTLQTTQTENESKANSLDAMLVAGVETITATRNNLTILEQNSQAFTARSTAATQLNEAVAEKAGRLAPVPYELPDWYVGAVKTREGLVASVTAANKVLSFLEQGKMECPTCGTHFADMEKQKVYQREVLAGLEPSLKQHNESIGQADALSQTSQQELQAYNVWLRGVEAREQQLRTSLATMPEGQQADEQQRVVWQQQVTEYDNLSSDLVVAKDAMGVTATALATAQGEVTRLEGDVTRLQGETVGKLTETALTGLRQALSQANELNEQHLLKSGEHKAHEGEIQRLQEHLGSLESDKAMAVATDEYRGMLERAYGVLHRDQLPQEVMLSYLGDLNRLCAKYLDVFGNPFAIHIPRDFDITVTRPDGYTCTASRESGGRKAALSIVFRFGINQLFASQVGVVALDEPTAYLDADNLTYVAEIIDQIHRVESETGLQIIMITHEERLISAFDHVERIG